jgi:hypothetical protein
MLADWWAEAIGWQVELADEDFIRQMVAQGFATEDETTHHKGRLVWKSGTAIVHPEGLAGAPRVLFQLVAEEKRGKNRIHLDLHTGEDDGEEVVRRLTAAGATVLHDGQQGPHTWMTLADPEGNEFCVSTT